MDDHLKVYDEPEGSQTSNHPDEIGSYKIRGTLGRGGMGTVYLAEQTEPVTRPVALKVINWGMESENIVARFRSEQQALAMMNHPYIATVYDAGKTPEGLPFFVMECVSGEPILKYCDKNKLTIDQRLSLFLKVCEGVQHAHQKMVIHRDLKPSNILVSEREGEPEPKLIDFGIAKSTKIGAFPNDPKLTVEGTPLGTPMYMSPEQVEGTHLDARVDVYALGVLLYEMLSGSTPFDSDNADYYHMLVKVMEETPLLPSQRFSKTGEWMHQIAEKRQLDAKSLAKMMRGDMDWVILKAMEKDRDKRYGSVAELRADVQAFMDCKPVSAKSKTMSYKAKKFMQRHKIGVAAAILLLTLLIFGVSGTSYGFIKALESQKMAEASEAQALETLAYLEKILASVDPSMQGREMRISDLLNNAVRMVEEDLTDSPMVESAIRRTIGWSFLEMGAYEEAKKQLLAAYEIQKKLLGSQNLETIDTQNALGRLHYKMGEFSASEAIHADVYEVEKEILGDADDRTLWTQYNLAKAIFKQGRYEEAEELLRNNVEQRASSLGDDHGHTLIAKNGLALLLAFHTKGEDALNLQNKTLDAIKESLGEEHPQTINGMANLVAIHFLNQQNAKAREVAALTIALQKKKLGENHPETLETQAYLAKALIHMGDLNEGEKLLREVYELQNQSLGASNPETIETLAYLAQVKYLEKDFPEAIDLAKAAESRAIKLLGSGHWLSAFCLGVHGLSLVEQGSWNVAETKLLGALEAYKPFQKGEKTLVKKTLFDHYMDKGEPEKAKFYSEIGEL